MSDTTLAAQPLTVVSEEEEMCRQAVREFAESEVRPLVHDMDEAARFDPALLRKFFEMGLMGIEIPESYGGAGGSMFMAGLAIEELARVDASAAIYVDVQNTLVNNGLIRWGNEDQKRRYIPRMCSDLLGAFALSEPASGSDAFALECKAEDKGTLWELPGRKFWTTNGAEAGLFIVFANTDFTNAFSGDRGVFTTAEYRYLFGLDWFQVLDLGVAGFVDYGGAWYAGSPTRTGIDFGIGLRVGFSRANSLEMNRIDIVRRVANDVEPAGWLLVIGRGFVFSTAGILNR